MMVQAEGAMYDQMSRKLDILQKIDTNTKIQIQFIHQRKMKGLLRLLEERAQYLQELEALGKESDGTVSLITTNEEMKKIALLIEAKQQEIIKDNNAALEDARAEQDYIAADLRRIDSKIKLQNYYDNQWVKFSGNGFNQKG